MFKRSWGSAAIVLAAVLGAMAWWLTSERIGAETDRVVTTGVGQQREMRLADGSQIILNTQTTLATRDSPEHLEIELRSGEALFNTSEKLKKPLRVAAGPATVEVSQGRLSIRRLSKWELVVRVFSGVARVSPTASLMHVKLESGHSATFRRDNVVVDSFSPEKAVRLQSWTKGRLLFDGDSLAEVTSEFNRYNREKILIADDSLAQFRIGGGYNATNPVGFTRALEATFNIRAVSVRSGGRGASVIVLTRRASEKSKRSAPTSSISGQLTRPCKAQVTECGKMACQSCPVCAVDNQSAQGRDSASQGISMEEMRSCPRKNRTTRPSISSS